MPNSCENFTPDGILLQQFVSSADQDSFSQIVARHTPMILGTASRVLGDHSEAEDVSQTTFLVLARKAHYLKGYRSVAGWLHRVARQMALDILRARQRRQQRENATHLMVYEPETSKSEPLFQLEEALSALPERYRAALIMHYSSGWTIEETAKELGCSASAASMQLTRGREKLRTALRRKGVLESVVPSMLLPAVESSRLQAQTLALVRSYVASQQASVGIAAWLNWCQRMVGPVFSHLKTTTTAMVLGAIMVVGLTQRSQSEGKPVVLKPTSSPANPIVSITVAPTPSLPQPDDGSSLIAAMLKDDGFMRLEFKRALDRNRLDLNSIHDATGRGLLHIAAEETLLNQFVLLLLYGVDPNSRDRDGKTPLHYVINVETEYGIAMRDGLLLRGANVNAADKDGVTPLMLVAREGGRKAAELLLWLGADLKPKGVPPEKWPISLARKNSRPEMVALLKVSESSSMPTLAGSPQMIPGFVQRSFTEAARIGDFDRLQSLMPYGAQINGLDTNGSTALIQAIGNLQADVITYLLMIGASPNATNKHGFSPMMAASCWYGQYSERIRVLLILAGSNPHPVSKKGHNALTFASYKGNEHAAQWAIWNGVDPKLAAPMGTAMRIASQEGQQKIINLLRLNGVTESLYVEPDPARRLILAARRNDFVEVRDLLARGVPIDSVDENGDNAVMNAIFSQRVKMARFLLKSGSGLNFENPKNGSTPLRATCCLLYPEMELFRKEILEAGANPNQPDQAGITPFIAACGGDLEPKITQMLEHGAELNLRDKKGHTALWHSHQNGRTTAYEFLKAKGAVE